MDLSSLSPMVGYFRCSSLPLSPLSLSVSYPYSHTLTLILFLSRTPAFSPSLPLSLSLTPSLLSSSCDLVSRAQQLADVSPDLRHGDELVREEILHIWAHGLTAATDRWLNNLKERRHSILSLPRHCRLKAADEWAALCSAGAAL